MPATPPGDDERDQWSRGAAARHGRDAGEYGRDERRRGGGGQDEYGDDGYGPESYAPESHARPDASAPWGRQDPPARGWQQSEHTQPGWPPPAQSDWPPAAEQRPRSSAPTAPAWKSRDGDQPGRQPQGDEPGWQPQGGSEPDWERRGDEPGWQQEREPEPAWPEQPAGEPAWASGHSGFDEPTALNPLVGQAPGAFAADPTAPAGNNAPDVAAPDGTAAAGGDAPVGHPTPAVPRGIALGVAGISALLTFGLVIGAMISHSSYAVAIFAVQVLFVLAWTVATRPPAPRVVAGVGLAAAAAADLTAVLVDPASLAPLAYVTAGGFVAGVVGQLTRPAGRVRVTESLGSTLALVVGVVAFSSLVVLSRFPGGTQALMAGVLAAGVAVVVARLVDVVAPYPRLAPQVPRGGAGVVAGAMLGTAVAAVAGSLLDGLTTGPTALAGLVAALVAVVVDLSIGYADAGRELAGDPPARWLARYMQGPLAAFALAAPAVYAATLLLL